MPKALPPLFPPRRHPWPATDGVRPTNLTDQEKRLEETRVRREREREAKVTGIYGASERPRLDEPRGASEADADADLGAMGIDGAPPYSKYTDLTATVATFLDENKKRQPLLDNDSNIVVIPAASKIESYSGNRLSPFYNLTQDPAVKPGISIPYKKGIVEAEKEKLKRRKDLAKGDKQPTAGEKLYALSRLPGYKDPKATLPSVVTGEYGEAYFMAYPTATSIAHTTVHTIRRQQTTAPSEGRAPDGASGKPDDGTGPGADGAAKDTDTSSPPGPEAPPKSPGRPPVSPVTPLLQSDALAEEAAGVLQTILSADAAKAPRSITASTPGAAVEQEAAESLLMLTSSGAVPISDGAIVLGMSALPTQASSTYVEVGIDEGLMELAQPAPDDESAAPFDTSTVDVSRESDDFLKKKAAEAKAKSDEEDEEEPVKAPSARAKKTTPPKKTRPKAKVTEDDDLGEDTQPKKENKAKKAKKRKSSSDEDDEDPPRPKKVKMQKTDADKKQKTSAKGKRKDTADDAGTDDASTPSPSSKRGKRKADSEIPDDSGKSAAKKPKNVRGQNYSHAEQGWLLNYFDEPRNRQTCQRGDFSQLVADFNTEFEGQQLPNGMAPNTQKKLVKRKARDAKDLQGFCRRDDTVKLALKASVPTAGETSYIPEGSPADQDVMRDESSDGRADSEEATKGADPGPPSADSLYEVSPRASPEPPAREEPTVERPAVEEPAAEEPTAEKPGGADIDELIEEAKTNAEANRDIRTKVTDGAITLTLKPFKKDPVKKQTVKFVRKGGKITPKLPGSDTCETPKAPAAGTEMPEAPPRRSSREEYEAQAQGNIEALRRIVEENRVTSASPSAFGKKSSRSPSPLQ